MIRRIKNSSKSRFMNLRDKIFANRPRIYTCDVRGHTILLDVESEIEKYRATTYATKEPETLEWIQRYFRPNDVMYDIGANIGVYSLFAAKYLNSACKVYAFEPEALNYAKLNKNVYLNSLSGVVFPCCLAVSDKLCFDMFNLHPNVFHRERIGEGLIAGSALHAFGESKDYKGAQFKPIHQQGMLGISLDYLVEYLALDFPNHIKIDVDGIEEQIISGATRTLGDPRLRSVLIEISAGDGSEDPIRKKLSSAGLVPDCGFREHSCNALKGTPYEDSVNTIFIRR